MMKSKLLIGILAIMAGLALCFPRTSLAVEIPADVSPLVDQVVKELDNDHLKETFKFLAPSIKKDEEPDLWYGRLVSERESMGEVKSRKLLSVEEVEIFGDLPKGKYLQITYQTEFSIHPDSQEMLVFVKEDGKYGLAGYKIQYNRWPEAIKIILNGLFLVFLHHDPSGHHHLGDRKRNAGRPEKVSSQRERIAGPCSA